MPSDAPVEMPFVGVRRSELAIALTDAFDAVAATARPRWISLEARTGWGKTRLVQELYRRLAGERQPDGTYWPASILGADPDLSAGRVSPDAPRKRVYPVRVDPAPGAVPAWFWWGITCGERAGTPFQALADDLTQFEQHHDGLERRWREDASLRRRSVRAVLERRGDLGDTAVDEAAGLLASAAGLAVPGLGFVLMAARWSIRSIRERSGADRSDVIDASGRGRGDLVEQLAPELARLARDVLPVVVVVEDVHFADESLIEVLSQATGLPDTRILLVTTAWPGLIDEPSRPAHALLTRLGDRCDRFRESGGTGPHDLPDLDRDELAVLVTARLPDAGPTTVDALTERYRTPLNLEVACTMPSLARAIARGDDGLALVAALPRRLDHLYQSAFDQLPAGIRTALSLGALCAPASVDAARGANDHRWEPALVDAAYARADWASSEVPALVSLVGDSAADYSWLRLVDHHFHRFNDPLQHAIAHERGEDPELASQDEREALYTLLAEAADTTASVSPMVRMHRARLLVAVRAAGLATSSIAKEHWLDACVLLASWLSAQRDTDSLHEAETLAREALGTDLSEDDPRALSLRRSLAAALGGTGRVGEAAELAERVVGSLIARLGPDHRETLAARRALTLWRGESGQIQAAIESGQSVLADSVRVLGTDDVDSLAARMGLSYWLAYGGQFGAALEQSEQVVADHVRVLGPDHPDTLFARHYRAQAIGDAGDAAAAVEAHEQLVADRTRVLGPNHPDTLTSRNNVGVWMLHDKRMAEACEYLPSVVAEHARVIGADHPKTLASRNNLAVALVESGRLGEGIDELTRVLVDRARLLGPEHPRTLSSRHNVLYWQAFAGLLADPGAAYDELLVDLLRVLGPDHRTTLMHREAIATQLVHDGDRDGASRAFAELLADLNRVLGPDHAMTGDVAAKLAELAELDTKPLARPGSGQTDCRAWGTST